MEEIIFQSFQQHNLIEHNLELIAIIEDIHLLLKEKEAHLLQQFSEREYKGVGDDGRIKGGRRIFLFKDGEQGLVCEFEFEFQFDVQLQFNWGDDECPIVGEIGLFVFGV
ncbi:MAG: hypothetical protein EZS28_015085 [Streblomastix strix]|uniref:Uncharacterized protein n=1 Tax=Streblomastix strix TaxID=222440 RepID=A0A5J4W3H9_9EUKA|nr:MAG: hypothetical protein EZS28_015085 [Streblomastix strix]